MSKRGLAAARGLAAGWAFDHGACQMLAEIKGVAQERGTTNRRRWFEDDALELIVWYREGDEPLGFQLCYQDADRREWALTWRAPGGFRHAWVESGDWRAESNMTPVLVNSDRPVPWTEIRGLFTTRAQALEPALRDFIAARLLEGNT